MSNPSQEAAPRDVSAPAARRWHPGPLFAWVKRASYVELALFAGLLIVWIAPGLHGATFVFGLAHGLGFIALALLVWVAVMRREAPYGLLAATLTPVGPVGSVVAIAYIERRLNADLTALAGGGGGAAGGRGSTRPAPPPARR
jgi:hypothetical protein